LGDRLPPHRGRQATHSRLWRLVYITWSAVGLGLGLGACDTEGKPMPSALDASTSLDVGVNAALDSSTEPNWDIGTNTAVDGSIASGPDTGTKPAVDGSVDPSSDAGAGGAVDGSIGPTLDGGSAVDLDASLASPPDLAKPPTTKKVLNFVWQGEQDYYMCGPSAARMALSARLSNLPSQQELGSYMGTTTNGTDSIGLVKNALNHYLNITTYAEVTLPNDPPSAAQQSALKKQLVESINSGYALVANVVSGWRPSFYPQSGTIYHYIALVGYDESGDKVFVADPAATGCGNGECGNSSSKWYDTPRSYWINTSDLGVWITPKGYTWHP
jgi:hypothetical protein